mgnify:CR=1 FL=1
MAILPDRKPLVDDDIVTCFRDGQVTLRKNRRTEGFTNALKELYNSLLKFSIVEISVGIKGINPVQVCYNNIIAVYDNIPYVGKCL